jgi:hypothetical protein
VTSSKRFLIQSFVKFSTFTCVSFVALDSNVQLCYKCFVSPEYPLRYSFSSCTAPDRSRKASMQLRTRLIIANTSLEGQTQVKVGHEIGLFQGECRVKRIDELFASVWLVRL